MKNGEKESEEGEVIGVGCVQSNSDCEIKKKKKLGLVGSSR